MPLILKKFLAAFTTVVLAILIGEVVSRLLLTKPFVELPGGRVGYGTSLYFVNKKAKSKGEERIEIPGLIAATAVGLRVLGNREVVIKNDPLSEAPVPIKTNELGFRGPPKDTSCTCPLLVLGDSITFSSYLPEDKLYTHLVGQYFKEKGLALTVHNASFIGYGLKDEVQLLEDLIEEVKPLGVVVQSYLNDAIPPQTINLFAPKWLGHSWFLSHISGSLAMFGPRVPFLERSNRDSYDLAKWHREVYLEINRDADLESKRNFNRLVLDNIRDWGTAWSTSMWSTMKPLYKRFNDLTLKHKAHPFVMLSPVKYQVDDPITSNFPQKALKQITADLGVSYLDLLPKFREDWKLHKRELFFDNCHYTPYGHQVLAPMLIEFLTVNGIEDLCARRIKSCAQ